MIITPEKCGEFRDTESEIFTRQPPATPLGSAQARETTLEAYPNARLSALLLRRMSSHKR